MSSIAFCRRSSLHHPLASTGRRLLSRDFFLTSMFIHSAMDITLLSTAFAGLKRGLGVDVATMVPKPSNAMARSALRGFFWIGDAVIEKGVGVMRDRFESETDREHREAEEVKAKRGGRGKAKRK